jgi:UDP-2-acetamido-3-amino-2,3-dideoxy-glucuronate N-acetyltransferase
MMKKKNKYQMGKNCTIYDGAIIFPNVRLGNNVTVFPGAVIGRPPLSSGATTRQLDVSELLPVEIGDNCIIGSNAVIYMGVKIGIIRWSATPPASGRGVRLAITRS